MKYIFIFILLIASINESSAGIISTHPRVWIDGTIKAKLQADATANTAEWQALKAVCDSKLASNNNGKYQTSGYHYNGWYEYVLSYGLCFQATGNQTYGNEGVVYLTGLLRDGADSGVIGDGGGGDTGIQKDSGYVSRSAGTGVAIGRDWLDGATDLTSTIITEATGRMATWVTWIKANAHAIDDPRDNYYHGHFAMIYTSAFSFYGDPGYQSSWLTDAESMWSDDVEPLVENGFYDGGDWAKGWNYAGWAIQELLGYILARDTATDDSDPWSATNFHEDVASSMINFLYPSRGYFSDNGMWSADIKGDPRSTLPRFLASMTPLTASEKGTLRWYIDNLTYEPNAPDEWQEFLYKVSDITSVTPTSTNMGGLSKKTDIGHFVARSDNWSNVNASFIEMFAYTDRKDPTTNNLATNGDYNVGDMRFASRGISLIVDGDRQQYTAHYNNVPIVTGSHTYAPYQEPWLYGKSGVSGYPTVFMTTGSTTDYAYSKASNLQNAYDGRYWDNNPSLNYYSRSLLAIWPDIIVVYDNITAASASNDVSVRWWFPREPTITGQTLTTTDAKADFKLSVIGINGAFDKPGTSADLRTVTGTTTYRDGYYYADFQTTGPPINNQMFTIMQATDHAVPPVSVAEIIEIVGGRGVLVGSIAAIFTNDQLGGNISTLSYETNAKTHYICDLHPLTEYILEASGQNLLEKTVKSTEAGIISFNLPNDGLTAISLLQNGMPSVAPATLIINSITDITQ